MLTIFLVVQDFHVFLFGCTQRLLDILSSKFVRLLAAEKITARMFLNQLCPAITRQLTKSIIAVNDGKIGHLRVSQDKIAIS